MEYILEELVKYIADSMPFLSTVDEDYGQLEMLDQDSRDTYPLAFPAVLIDAPEASWSNLAGRSQIGTVSVRTRLLIDCYDDTHSTSQTTERISEREIMRRKLHLLLQGHCICGSAPLSRTSSRFYTGNHGIKVYEMTYTSEIKEYAEDKKTIVAAPVVKVKAGIIPR